MEVRIKNDSVLILPEAEKKDFGQIGAFDDLAKNTTNAYFSDASLFCYWIQDIQPPLDNRGRAVKLGPAEIGKILSLYRITESTIIKFIQEFGFHYKPSTLKRKLASITWLLNELGKPPVTRGYLVKKALKTLERMHVSYRIGEVTAEEVGDKGFKPPEKSAEKFDKTKAPALMFEQLCDIIDFLDYGQHKYSELNVLRLKTMLLTWWHGACRISEVSRIKGEDLLFYSNGMKIIIRKSKTDQSGTGLEKPYIYYKDSRYCAITHLRKWLQVLGENKQGYLFVKLQRNGLITRVDKPLSGRAFTNKLKELSKEAGIETDFSGHSPRRGFASHAYNIGGRAEGIQAVGGWQSDIWKEYVDDMSSIENHPLNAGGSTNGA